MARDISETSTYTDRLIKLIPTEWVSAYVAIRGILQSSACEGNNPYYFVMIILGGVLPFYLIRVLKVTNRTQIIVTVFSFFVWVFSLGGAPFSTQPFYEPYQSSILLTLWTVCLPIFVGNSGKPKPTASGTDSATAHSPDEAA